jgi:hypothetical protein
LNISPTDFLRIAPAAADHARRLVATVFQNRLDACRKTLEALTDYGADTGGEETEKGALLYEFWALTRALRSDP